MNDTVQSNDTMYHYDYDNLVLGLFHRLCCNKIYRNLPVKSDPQQRCRSLIFKKITGTQVRVTRLHWET